MHSSKIHIVRTEAESADRFNDSEYERWSDGLKTAQPRKSEPGLDSFLNIPETLQEACEDLSATLKEIIQK
jgi:hypothetical protein